MNSNNQIGQQSFIGEEEENCENQIQSQLET